MCDNLEEFAKICRAESGIDRILCKPHATGKTLACICIQAQFQGFFLIQCPAGISALQYSHVKYFPNHDAFGEYYDFVIDICDIGVKSFATRAQTIPPA
jgi:hypothetical protein